MVNVINSNDIQNLPHRKQVMFALFCAKQVIHLVEPHRRIVCAEAIYTVELWLEGKATAEQCKDAAKAVYATGVIGSNYATWTIARTAYATCTTTGIYYDAAVAAYYADKITTDEEKTIKEQRDYYDTLLNLDKYAEELLNG